MDKLSRKDKMMIVDYFKDEYMNYLSNSSHEGKGAYNYLSNNRKLTHESIYRWKLGVANSPLDIKSLVRSMSKDEAWGDEFLTGALDIGLISQGKSDWYEYFNGRIVFPIMDDKNQPVGFSGRALPGSKQEEFAKYMNSKSSDIFDKGSILYGQQYLQNELDGGSSTAVIFEGFMDVISADQVGVKNVLGTMGTNITDKQLELLKKHGIKQVVLCPDTDRPGMEAGARNMQLLLDNDIEVQFANMGDCKDANEFMIKYGEDALRDRFSVHYVKNKENFYYRYLKMKYPNVNKDTNELIQMSGELFGFIETNVLYNTKHAILRQFGKDVELDYKDIVEAYDEFLEIDRLALDKAVTDLRERTGVLKSFVNEGIDTMSGTSPNVVDVKLDSSLTNISKEMEYEITAAFGSTVGIVDLRDATKGIDDAKEKSSNTSEEIFKDLMKNPNKNMAEAFGIIEAECAGYSYTDITNTLKNIGRFHNYSFRNQMLIQKQLPGSMLVASFETWNANNRTVTKGSKAIKILYPKIKRVEKLDSNGNPKYKDGKKLYMDVIAGYGYGNVFDVTQTIGRDGKEMNLTDTIGVKPIMTDPKAIERITSDLISKYGIEVKEEIISTNNAKGYYVPLTGKIVIDSSLDQKTKLQVIIHELAHKKLHNLKQQILNNTPENIMEIQAEAVAFATSYALGFETKDEQIKYIKLFTKHPGEIYSNLEIVSKTTSQIVNEITRLSPREIEKLKIPERNDCKKHTQKNKNRAFNERSL